MRFFVFFLAIMILPGCSRLVGTTYKDGQHLKTEQVASRTRSEVAIDFVTWEKIKVTKREYNETDIADFYEKVQVDTHRTCSALEILALPIRVISIIGMFDWDTCLFGDYESSTETVVEGETVQKNLRKLAGSKYEVNVGGTKALFKVAGKELERPSLQGSGESEPVSFARHIASFSPLNDTEICYEYEGWKKCASWKAKDIPGLSGFKGMITRADSYYEACESTNSRSDCEWAAVLQSAASPPDDKKTKRAYLRLCGFHDDAQSCGQARALGLGREVDALLANKKTAREAELAAKKEQEALQRKKEQVEEAKRQARAEEAEARRRQEYLAEQRERKETQKMIMDGVKSISDSVSRSAEQHRNQMRSLYGY